MDLRLACSLAGISYRTGARWIESGIVQPQGYLGIQGSPVPITRKEARELRILAKLRGVLSLQALKQAAVYLRARGDNPYSDGRFAALKGPGRKRRLIKCCRDGQVIDLLDEHQGQPLLLVPLCDKGAELKDVMI